MRKPAMAAGVFLRMMGGFASAARAADFGTVTRQAREGHPAAVKATGANCEARVFSEIRLPNETGSLLMGLETDAKVRATPKTGVVRVAAA